MYDWLAKAFGEQNASIAYVVFIVVAILVALWVALRLGRALRDGIFVAGGNTRKHRLAVLDATPIDNRRRLVLVSRDDVEHLILIGGMNDVIIESNIAKKTSATTATQQIPRLQPTSETMNRSPSATVIKSAPAAAIAVGAAVGTPATPTRDRAPNTSAEGSIVSNSPQTEWPKQEMGGEVQVDVEVEAQNTNAEIRDQPSAKLFTAQRNEPVVSDVEAEIVPKLISIPDIDISLDLTPNKVSPETLPPKTEPVLSRQKVPNMLPTVDTVDNEIDELLNRLAGTPSK